MRAAFALVATLGLLGCDAGPFTGPLVLGGRGYTRAELNRGFHVYRQYCRACHGDLGDGHGVSATGLWPPPRDLRQGIYKFGRVAAPGLPPDEELARIVRGGLGGTAMLPWALPDRELDALLGYVKSLAPRWRTDKPEPLPEVGADPYASRDQAALRTVIERGEALYHGTALCSTCHPAYVTRARLYEITKALGAAVTAYSPEMYTSRVKDTEYCWRWHQPSGPEPSCDEVARAVPPDFTHDPLRAVRPAQAARDLFLTLAGGITGAGMPPWKGVLPDDDLWAIAYYVRSLAALRDTPAGDAARTKLLAQDNIGWQAPAGD